MKQTVVSDSKDIISQFSRLDFHDCHYRILNCERFGASCRYYSSSHKKIKCLCVLSVWCGSHNFVCTWKWD